MKKFNLIPRLSFVFALSFLLLLGCGKKEDGTNKTDDKKNDSKETTDKSNFSADKPFLVEFEITGKEGKGNGTVTAVYDGKKCRSTSTFDMDGKKFSATAYFDGGDVVYTVSEVAGVKMGMKMDKKKFSDAKDNVDVNSFRDYIDQMEKIGEEEIIGYKCEIYKHKEKNFTVSLHEKTVPLRMGTSDGKTFMKATKLEQNVKVTDDMFTAPKDVNYVDMTNMLEDMKNMKDGGKNMQDLKDKTKEMEEIMKNYKK